MFYCRRGKSKFILTLISSPAETDPTSKKRAAVENFMMIAIMEVDEYKCAYAIFYVLFVVVIFLKLEAWSRFRDNVVKFQ